MSADSPGPLPAYSTANRGTANTRTCYRRPATPISSVTVAPRRIPSPGVRGGGPGYLHDTFSSWHPLFVSGPAYAALGELLHQHGLEYRNTDGWVTASVADDGRATLAHRDPERTAAGFAHAEDRSAYLAMLQRLGENMAVTGVSFVLPAPEQSKKSRLVRLQLLCWLARYSGYDANDKPLSQTNYDPQRSWREGRDPIITSDSSDSTSFRTDT